MNVEEVLVELMGRNDLVKEYQFCVFRPYIKKRSGYPPVMKVPDSVFWVSRERTSKNFLSYLRERYIVNDETALGLTSLVRLIGDRKGHLPLIDFNCGKFSEDLMRVYENLKYLKCLEGYLLDSGRSYHFIGTNPLDNNEFIRFLNHMSGSEIIGDNWPRLQKETGFAVLRLTACPKRGKPYVPTLVDRIEDTQLRFPKILNVPARI